MKTNLEKVSNLERKLNVEIPAVAVEAAFEKLFKQVQKDAHIKGFRPGKAPIEKIKSLYAHQVKQEVVQDLIQKHYSDALKEHSVDPISYPEFEFDSPEEGKDFSFTALFEIRPEIVLKKYENLEVEKEKLNIEDSRITKVLENIQASKAEQVTVFEDRPAQVGDISIIDFDGYVDGQPLQGGKGENHSLELGSNSFIEGFEDGIVGMKVGQQKSLNLKFPSPYHAKELEGKAVEFKVTLKELKKKVLPELTDEFLKQIGGSGTVEELKTTIRNDIEQSEKKRIDQDLKNRLLKQLVTLNPVEVPPSMLKEQKQLLIDDMKKKMLDQGMSDEEFIDYTKKWDGDFNSTAAEMIQAGFIIDVIAGKHELRCTKEDLDKKMDEYSKQTGLDFSKIKEFYSKPEQTQRLAYMITEEKVIEFLLKSAKVTEVDSKKIKESAN